MTISERNEYYCYVHLMVHTPVNFDVVIDVALLQSLLVSLGELGKTFDICNAIVSDHQVCSRPYHRICDRSCT